MSTFNAGSNKTFNPKSPNRTFNKSPNKTFDSRNANRTFNKSGPSRMTNNSNLNRTYDANSNQTFNVNNPNATFDVQAPNAGPSRMINTSRLNRTFNANQNPNATFDFHAPNTGPSRMTNATSPNRTYDANPNQTFNINNPNATFDVQAPMQRTYNVPNPGMQTFNVPNPRMQTYNVQNQSSSAQSPINQKLDVEEPMIGPEAPLKHFTPYEKKLLNDIEKLCNEIRSFIMSIYKFFCNNRGCNWEAVFALIGEIDLATQSMINEIFLQQMKIDDEREATRYSDDQSSSNVLPSTFDSQSSEYDDSFEHENQSVLDDLQSRLSHLNVSDGPIESLIAGLLNINRAEGNLRDFRNYDN